MKDAHEIINENLESVSFQQSEKKEKAKGWRKATSVRPASSVVKMIPNCMPSRSLR